jgi:hypothetical protein
MNRRIASTIVVAVLTVIISSSSVSRAQIIRRRAAVYSVKFLCGFQNGVDVSQVAPQFEPPVKPGNYATAVNIHNFHTFPVNICKKAVLAPPERCFTPNPFGCLKGFVGPVIPITVGPDLAFEVDCQDIATTLLKGSGPLPPFIKGFVEIAVIPQSGLPLTNPISVTGVYTSITCANPFDPSTFGTCSAQNPSHFLGFGTGLEIEPQNSFIGEPTCG